MNTLISRWQQLGSLVLACILLVGLTACSQETENPPVRLQGQIFGTFWLATFPGNWSEEQAEQLEAGIIRELEAVDASMSTYRDSSELSRLNQAEPGTSVPVSQALMEVLQLSQQIAEASNGALDVTVGGLVNLWSFGPEARPEEIPSQEELQDRLAAVGYQHLLLDAEQLQVTRTTDSYIDLSALAKGYAVDQVGTWLKSQGVNNFLVNIGGEVLVGGERKPGQPWRIGIELPEATSQQAYHILPLINSSVATSGDYRNYYEIDGQRMSHTLNPVSGRPIDHQLASVTVEHPSNAVADAWATAFMVMGREEALKVAEQEGIRAIMITREEDSWKTWLSQPMQEHLGPELTQQLLSH
ncbi:FAD:protein FMN transferase [Marinospirillum perlucidum]|uniref:FAD:protein FMN transferase n=1 Tax=Marinospirillum perlucidum TaxID=1982602 RepID=UPI000DF1F0C8|nr:FAD:protein FMN transferase [Marinospirillum perlucidum]